MAITPGDYAGYDSVTTDVTKVDSTETDFPYYIDLANLSATWWSNVQSDGGDIRVTTNDDGTGQVPIEVVAIDTVAETGELHFKDSTDSASAKTYYVWCGTAGSDSQPAVGATYGRNAVWSKYGGVYHFQNTSGVVVDSSGNNDGTNNGATRGVSGLIGNGFDMDGSSDYVDTNLNLGTIGTVTYSFFNTQNIGAGESKQNDFQLGDTGTNSGSTIAGRAFDPPDGDTNLFYIIMASGGVAWYWVAEDFTVTPNKRFEANTWYTISYWYDSSDSSVYLSINGEVVKGTPRNSPGIPSYSNIDVGRANNNSSFSDSSFDEVRASTSPLLGGWHVTEYNMQNSNSTFYTFNGWTALAEDRVARPLSFGGKL